MATRVNSRFIIITLASVAIAAGLVVAMWAWQARGNAERLARQGDEQFDRGEYAQAMGSYGRAARREPDNIDYLRKLEAAILRQRPETTDAANHLYQQLMDVRMLEAQYHAASAESHLRLLRELHYAARVTEKLSHGTDTRRWQQIRTAAEAMLDRVSESDADRAFGLLYRGMATLHLRATSTDRELEQAENDLVEFNVRLPNHDLGWGALARGQMVLEEHARLSGDPRRVERRNARMAEVMSQAREAVPDGPEVSTVYAAYMAARAAGEYGGGEVSVSELEESMDVMTDVLGRLAADDPRAQWLILDAVEVLQRGRGVAGRPAAIRLVQQRLDRDEEAIVHRQTLALLHMRAREFDTAEALAEDVLGSDPLPAGLISRMQSQLRRSAAALIGDVHFQRWSDASDGDRDRHVAAMREARARLREFVIDPETDRQMIRTDAKLAVMEGDYDASAAKFEQLVHDGNAGPDVLSGSAFSLLQIGEVGLALERATAANSAAGGQAPALLLLKAQIEFQLRRLDAAANTISQYLRFNPDDEAGQHLSRSIQAAVAGRGFNPDDPAQALLFQAESLFNEGTPEGIESAQSMLLGALEAHPDDARLLGMLASVRMYLGDTDGARELIERALEIAPEFPLLKQMEAVVRTGDPVEAMIEYFGGVEDEVDRQAGLMLGLGRMHAQQADVAARLRESGQPDEADEAVALAVRAGSEADRAEQELRRLAPNHVVLIEADFKEAMENQDWAGAAEVVRRAAEANADNLGGLLFEGRFELERRPPRVEQAVRVFQRATEQRPFSASAWRGLGIAYQRAGNTRESLRAFERSHSINPNDIHTVRAYLAVLIQTGDQTRAARVARDASRVAPGDIDLRELWLGLEAETNNTVVVLRRREELYRTNPNDRLNASRLALLLATNEPTYDMLYADDGNPLFTERQWNAMRLSEQRATLDRAREQWRVMSWRIVEEMENRFGRDFELARLRAALLRNEGDVTGGERVLRDHIAHVEQRDDLAEGEPSEPMMSAVLALASYQLDVGQIDESLASFAWAARHQSPQTRMADLALADALFARSRFERARELYAEVAALREDRAVELRLAECEIKLGQYEQANRRLDALAAAQPEFTIEMLRAGAAQGRAAEHRRAGREADAAREMERYEAALSSAERMSPTNPTPHIARARGYIAEHRRSKRRSLIDEALKALDRAEAVRAGDPQTSMARVEVHREAGNARAATGELTRLLERRPQHNQARRALVQMHADAGNIAPALDVVQQAIDLSPTTAAWHELKANLYTMQQPPNYAEASSSYRRAYELSGSLSMLHRQVGVLIRRTAPPPDYAAALRVLQGERDAIDRDPSLEAVLGHVLIESGRVDDGRQRLRRSYVRTRTLIADGSREPSVIGAWYQAAGPILARLSDNELEQTLAEYSAASNQGEPDRFEQVWIARTYSSRGPLGRQRAIELLRSAAESPEASEHSDFRAAILLEISSHQIALGEHTAGARTLEQVLALQPENWVALNNLAFMMTAHLDDASGALPHSRRAAELRPDDASVLDTLGWTYFKLGQYEQAETYLRDSLVLAETAQTQLHMAHVLYATGRFEAAQSRLRRAAELNPDSQTQADIDRLADDIRTKQVRAQ